MGSHALKHGGYRVLVTGGRAYADREAVFKALRRIGRKHGIACIIHGQCMQPGPGGQWVISGADRWADEYAEERGIPCARYPVPPGDWKIMGKRAGNARNTRMIAEGVPDLCVYLPGGSGTWDCVSKCRERGILTWDPITNDVR